MSFSNDKKKRPRRGDRPRIKTSKYVGISEAARTCAESTSRIIAWCREQKMPYLIANQGRAAKRKAYVVRISDVRSLQRQCGGGPPA